LPAGATTTDSSVRESCSDEQRKKSQERGISEFRTVARVTGAIEDHLIFLFLVVALRLRHAMAAGITRPRDILLVRRRDLARHAALGSTGHRAWHRDLASLLFFPLALASNRALVSLHVDRAFFGCGAWRGERSSNEPERGWKKWWSR
jgi:hypothetical protein